MPRRRAPQGLSAVETCPPSPRPGDQTTCNLRRTPSRRTGEWELMTPYACEPRPEMELSWRSVPPWWLAGGIPVSSRAVGTEAQRTSQPASVFGPAPAIPECDSREQGPIWPNGSGFGLPSLLFPRFGARLQRFPAGGRCGVMQSGPGTVPGDGLPFREPGRTPVGAHPVGPAVAEAGASECSANPAR